MWRPRRLRAGPLIEVTIFDASGQRIGALALALEQGKHETRVFFPVPVPASSIGSVHVRVEPWRSVWQRLLLP